MGFLLPTCFLFLLLSYVFHLVTVHGNKDLDALMKVKTALDPEGGILSSWEVGNDPCSGSFIGVACNKHGLVANISLQGKGLWGSISPAMANLTGLTGLYLHYNGISGSVPKEISKLTQLSDLYLNVNNLSGNIPAEIGGMVNLQVLQLGYNQMTGSIPTQLGLLKNLRVLSLQHNHFNGAIPATLGHLTQLTWMDLSFNHLFGSIPVALSQASQLYVLKLQNNSLSGNIPSELKRLNAGFEYGNNSDLCGAYFSSLKPCAPTDILKPDTSEPYVPHFTAFNPQDIPLSANISSNCNASLCSNPSKASVATAFIGGVIVLVAGTTICFLAFTWYRRRQQRNVNGLLDGLDSTTSHIHLNELYQKRASPLASLEYSKGWDPLADGRCGAGLSKEVTQSFRFNIEEVECATQYFSAANLIRKSNFSATYKGVLRDGSMVAVKCISKTSCKSEETEVLKGLKILTKLQHHNLVRLRGFCCSRARGQCFLVYDFISNGKLSQFLDGKSEKSDWFLDWPTRVSIIRGIATGIEFLHSSSANKPSIIHQNISADKILLDNNCNPCISCSGLHQFLADDVIFSTFKIMAAMGYLAPEYTRTGRLTEKSDVYAFGIIVLQILTGKQSASPFKFNGEHGSIEDLIDGNLKGNFLMEEATKLAEIALFCISDAPSERPTMEGVLKELTNFSVG